MKSAIRQIHRYASLTMVALWVIQALSGVLMVFHWELDDAGIAGEHRAFDADLLGARVADLQATRTGQTVTSLYPTGGTRDRFDIYLENPDGDTDSVRVDGHGTILIERPLDYDFAHTGIIQAAVILHQSLFAGDRGRLFIGFSGLLLLSNLILGLTLAWPKAGQWSRALTPVKMKMSAALLYSWHRAVGLWLAIPALVFVTAGMLLAFDEPLGEFLGTDSEPAVLSTVAPVEHPTVGPAEAMKIALAHFPGSSISGVRFPNPDRGWYRIRVRQPGEIRRVFGTTVVYVSASEPRVLAVEDAFTAPANERFMNVLYPVHTGEVGGVPGRLLTLTVGIWLCTMLTLGLSLWWLRRRARRANTTTTATEQRA